MSKTSSYLSRFSPSRERSKAIDWPFPADGDEPPPRVVLHILGAHEMEAANIAAGDHIASLKVKGAPARSAEQTAEAFRTRERIEQIWRAVRDLEGQPLEDSAAELAKQPPELLGGLFGEWDAFQTAATLRPLTGKQMDLFIEEVKKKPDSELLNGLPSTWLLQLLRGLASRSETSPTTSEPG